MAVNPGAELSSINFGALIGGPLVAVIDAQTQAARATADFITTVGFDADKNPIYVSFKYPKEVTPFQPAPLAQIVVTNPGAGYTTAPTVGGLPTGVTASVEIGNGKVTGITLNGSVTSVPTLTISPPHTPSETGDVTATAIFKPAGVAVPAQYATMQIEVPILTMLPIPFIRVEEATVDFNAKINSMETTSQSSDVAISGNLEVRQRWPSGSAKLNVSASYQKKSASGSSVERAYSMQVHVRATQDEMPAGMEKLLGLLESAIKSAPVPVAA